MTFLKKYRGLILGLVAMIVFCCGMPVGVGAALYGISVVITGEPVLPPPDDGYKANGCRKDLPHCNVVRAARAKIAPLEADILPLVTTAFNKIVPGHVKWARQCMSRRESFEKMERKSLYPIELIMGIASHESEGCRMIKARNGDGGFGAMQITNAPVLYKARAAQTLGLAGAAEIDLKDAVHNVAVGVMIFDDCERSTGRRDLALLCYNRGILPVQRAARFADKKWKQGKPFPRYVLIHPYINGRVFSTFGSISKRYTADVLAEMVLVKMVMDGKDPKDVDELTLDDIPGWDPRHDGDTFVDKGWFPF